MRLYVLQQKSNGTYLSVAHMTMRIFNCTADNGPLCSVKTVRHTNYFNNPSGLTVGHNTLFKLLDCSVPLKKGPKTKYIRI